MEKVTQEEIKKREKAVEILTAFRTKGLKDWNYTAGEFNTALDVAIADMQEVIDIKRILYKEEEDQGDYPGVVENQFDNMTGSMNL